MLISKFDLYRPGWLELVFDRRNKAYGAYDLRQHYAGNMVRAMGITFFIIALLCGASIILKSNAVVVNRDRGTIVTITPYIQPPPVVPPKRINNPIKATPPPLAEATQKDLVMVVKPDAQAIAPIKNAQLTEAIGPVDSKGPTGGENVLPAETTAGTGTLTAPDESIHSLTGLDVMPQPVGGENAWAKFLRKNLRFPSEAQDARVSGRVILSFVIEKDGRLSNIVIERGASYGFDEEALRVLKLAKAWTPGQQNGQPVRVKYLIPINFQMSEDER
jgi:protein TonB